MKSFPHSKRNFFVSTQPCNFLSMSVNKKSTRLVCVKQVESFILLFIYTWESCRLIIFLCTLGAVKASLTMPAACEKCSMPMNFGEMAIFTFRAGPEICWHVQCFVCSEDSELLVDHIYCWDTDNKKLYCPRHWSEFLKPRCAGCEEVCFSHRKGYAIAVQYTRRGKWWWWEWWGW